VIEARKKRLEDGTLSLKQALVDRQLLLKQLLESTIQQKQKYEGIIAIFSGQKAEVLADLDFVAVIWFDMESFLRSAESILDQRKVDVRKNDKTSSAFDTLFKLYAEVASGKLEKVESVIEEIERCNTELTTKLKGPPLTPRHFYDVLYGNYLRVVPTVRYKKTNLEKLSLGQKATVLIKIYLARGEKPIIIDSHDDHLDNEFIMDELVRAIRQAKSYRQIILVSNNGNVVINSDAEQIIIANIASGTIWYDAGSIENPRIRDRALMVLEGGHEAFKKRQQKYRITS
jgi:hypothetical protein